jgi:hypothetical protein
MGSYSYDTIEMNLPNALMEESFSEVNKGLFKERNTLFGRVKYFHLYLLIGK